MACIALMPILNSIFVCLELCRKSSPESIGTAEPTLPEFAQPEHHKKNKNGKPSDPSKP